MKNRALRRFIDRQSGLRGAGAVQLGVGLRFHQFLTNFSALSLENLGGDRTRRPEVASEDPKLL